MGQILKIKYLLAFGGANVKKYVSFQTRNEAKGVSETSFASLYIKGRRVSWPLLPF